MKEIIDMLIKWLEEEFGDLMNGLIAGLSQTFPPEYIRWTVAIFLGVLFACFVFWLFLRRK